MEVVENRGTEEREVIKRKPQRLWSNSAQDGRLRDLMES